MLASGSNDNSIRLWNIQQHVPEEVTKNEDVTEKNSTEDSLHTNEASTGELKGGGKVDRRVSMKQYMLTAKSLDGRFGTPISFNTHTITS